MMRSEPRSAFRASGRSRPCVSEITPMIISTLWPNHAHVGPVGRTLQIDFCAERRRHRLQALQNTSCGVCRGDAWNPAFRELHTVTQFDGIKTNLGDTAVIETTFGDHRLEGQRSGEGLGIEHVSEVRVGRLL